jgi:hypothetical protein
MFYLKTTLLEKYSRLKFLHAICKCSNCCHPEKIETAIYSFTHWLAQSFWKTCKHNETVAICLWACAANLIFHIILSRRTTAALLINTPYAYNYNYQERRSLCVRVFGIKHTSLYFNMAHTLRGSYTCSHLWMCNSECGKGARKSCFNLHILLHFAREIEKHYECLRGVCWEVRWMRTTLPRGQVLIIILPGAFSEAFCFCLSEDCACIDSVY